jgi:hypothetical protein
MRFSVATRYDQVAVVCVGRVVIIVTSPDALAAEGRNYDGMCHLESWPGNTLPYRYKFGGVGMGGTACVSV